MTFAPDDRVRGSNRDQVKGYGNALTPCAAEVIVFALVEAITGEEVQRDDRTRRRRQLDYA